METNPTVCAVMLVNGREAMVHRAIRAFDAQTYKKTRLIAWNTGPQVTIEGAVSDRVWLPPVDREHFRGASIGTLRNAANKYALAHYTTNDTRAEVLMHWDSDDWSHPNRIAEQVALLVDSGKECVGYNEVLFWRETSFTVPRHEVTMGGILGGEPDTHRRFIGGKPEVQGEAWLYRNVRHEYAIGASLCYWRDVWERQPFPDLPKKKGGDPEDNAFLRAVRSEGVPAFGTDHKRIDTIAMPRMICGIHGGNSMDYSGEYLKNGYPSWQRVPQWDEHCRATMAL